MASIFKFLTVDDESRLLDGAERRRYLDGDVIVREGDRVHCLFILRSGSARVERSHGEYSVEISMLEAGELFGEMCGICRALLPIHCVHLVAAVAGDQCRCSFGVLLGNG